MSMDKRSGAVLSADEMYRYRLHRWIDTGVGKKVCFIMLNPSTADAENDDPTIRRCLGFAKREGAEFLHVVNLFGFRATDPKDLKKAEEPIGGLNNKHIIDVAKAADVVICAWGNHGAYKKRGRDVVDILEAHGVHLQCLGKSKTGQPKHPLYLKNDTPLEPYGHDAEMTVHAWEQGLPKRFTVGGGSWFAVRLWMGNTHVKSFQSLESAVEKAKELEREIDS